MREQCRREQHADEDAAPEGIILGGVEQRIEKWRITSGKCAEDLRAIR